MKIRQILAVGAASVLGSVIATTAQSQVRVTGAVTTITLPSQLSQLGGGIDFANAKPMPMPAALTLPPSAAAAINSAVNPLQLFQQSGGAPGYPGTGEENPMQLVAPQDIPQGTGIEPAEFGNANQPYTTSEVNAYGDLTSKYYPFSAAGKLFFNIGTASYLCSASLIKPGIVVTAAHCVANYGQKQFYSGWTYVPAYNNGTAPYGTWTAQSATLPTPYYGTGIANPDNCYQVGVICPDDVAVITLNPQNGKYPGTTTGWFGYYYGGSGYNGSGQALITQLGYPMDLDGGLLMQRTDSQGFINVTFSMNTIIGSLMTAGSSGGPWVVNLGTPPALSGGDTFGTYAGHNAVVGVTSWDYNNNLAVKQQGASPFTSGNIEYLLTTVCNATPGAC